MKKITELIGRQIIDSRGNPTVEADIFFEDGGFGRASVPSGASKGKHEAFELRDGEEHFNGLGIRNALQNINVEIRNAIVGSSFENQSTFDKSLINLDGTPNKSRLGANSTLALSMAWARADCNSKKSYLFQNIADNIISDLTPNTLPVPLMNIINGGKHANNNLDIQEFMIVPVGANSIAEAIKMGCEIFNTLKSKLEEGGMSSSVGDEGGFTPNLQSNEEALSILTDAIESARYIPGEDIMFAIDCASSEYFDGSSYNLSGEGVVLSKEEHVEYLSKLVEKYPIVSIEDGMSEDDWLGWSMLTETLGKKVQLVGDDLFVTNINRIKRGISSNCANSVLIKPNQIGTISETIDSVSLSHKNGYACIMSHRSGETEDNFIADLCVATGCMQIKTGSLSRSERLSKYNQLTRIEEVLAGRSNFLKSAAFRHLS